MTGEQLGRQEQEGHPEILDLENHRGFYGRLLMASQAPAAEIANIINPATPVEFNFAADKVPLDKRNYNPVFENLSFTERQKAWTTPYKEAYEQWRTQFTEFMNTKIEKGSSRELALQTILSNSKTAEEFRVEDADQLFNEFCNGKSDINKFIERVTTNLVSGGEINPTNLQELLPHLQWIASGLFGRQTSGMATRLVELESQLHNNYAHVLGAFILDKERIRIPQLDERNVLSALHNLILQEKRIPIQVTAVSAPAVSEPTPQPAPVITDEDKDKRLKIPPSPPPAEIAVPTASGGEPVIPEEKALGETGENGEIVSVTDEMITWRDGNREVNIRKYNGDEMWMVFYNDGNSKFPDSTHGLLVDNFDLADIIKGLKDRGFQDIEADTAEKIYQALAKSFSDGLKEHNRFFVDFLKEFPDTSIIGPNGEKILIMQSMVSPPPQLVVRYNDQMLYGNEIKKLDPREIRLLNIGIGKALLETWIKSPPTPAKSDLVPASPAIAGQRGVSSAGPEPEKTTIGENIINMEDVSPDELDEKLNEVLSQNKNEPHITFSFLPVQLKEYITSSMVEKGIKVQGGTTRVDEDNKMIIEGIQISRSLGRKVTLDLIIQNTEMDIPFGGKLIEARVQDRKGNNIISKLPRQAQFIFTDIQTAVQEYLDKMKSPNNSSWSAGKISISGDKVLIEFETALHSLLFAH